MNTSIMSAFDAISAKSFKPKTIIIRINQTNSHPDLHAPPQDELRLKFDDIQDRDITRQKQGLEVNKQFLTNEIIDKIVEFLEKNKDAENLICQCQAGISRSAGLAIALNESYFKDRPEVRRLRRLCQEEGKRPSRHVRYTIGQYCKNS